MNGPQDPDKGRPESEVADGKQRRLDPRIITVSRIAGGIAAAVLAVLSSIFLLVVFLMSSSHPVVGVSMAGGWMLAVALLVFFVLWWPAVRHRYTFYTLHEGRIVIRRGVLFRSVHSIPRSRVQHTDVSQGPVERSFELATLVIYTAGTQHASVSLEGLPRDRAFLIRDHLIAGGEDDAV